LAFTALSVLSASSKYSEMLSSLTFIFARRINGESDTKLEIKKYC
tara:strand:- start:486 stop:620 length:135 start_codon:yes stop_codon:yes gene_type:complete